MDKLEKVIKGLECCDGNGVKCDSCPYWQDIPDEYQVSCNDHLCRDAKEVIEEAYITIGRCYSKIDKLLEAKQAEKGHWYEYISRGSKTLCCSVCGEDANTTLESNFCPNCGADMRKGR